MSRSRAFCFTTNNYTDEHTEKLAELSPDVNPSVSYLIFGREVGDSGTPHLQGYVYFSNPRPVCQVIKLFPGSHIEIARGDSESNFTYCSKGGDFWEGGVRPVTQKGKGDKEKTRWSEARLAAEEGRYQDIPDELYIKYQSSFKKMRLLPVPTTLDGELTHVWYYGPPGTGKSRFAREQFPGAYIKNPKNAWFDNYDGEAVVIIDDFDKFQVAQGGDMKRWLDRYPFQAESKGSMQLIRPTTFVITSNYHPTDIWDDAVTQQAILRRVKVIYFPLNPLHTI